MKEKIKYLNGISKGEQNAIYKVLNNYNFNILNITKIRSVYKVETTVGDICLKKISRNINKVYTGYNIVNELNKNNFNNTLKYILTKDDKLLVKQGKINFYCTQWINGTECTFGNNDEAISCVKLLGQFHKAVKKINIEQIETAYKTKNWIDDFNKKFYEIDRFKRIIEKKLLKNEFDILYSNNIDMFCERAINAIGILKSSKYNKIKKQYTTLCHNSFYYQNIIKKDNNYYIIDFDSISKDLEVYDLGKFIRRLMYKKEYNWNFDKVKDLINAYVSVNPLSNEELLIMLSLLIFPHKFWKIGKKRYIRYKNWSEQKYVRKLNRILKYDNNQEDFIKRYSDYYINFINTGL